MRKTGSYLAFLFFLLLVNVYLSSTMFQQGVAWQLFSVQPERAAFRQLSLSGEQLAALAEVCRCSGLPAGELMTILSSDASTSAGTLGSKAEAYIRWKRLMLRYNPKDYERISRIYGAIWNDVVCFPVTEEGTAYENSWMFERNYGGKRGHEGTDLMPPENLRGYYCVYSMTDGVVEKVGWLPLGGYRIGIRSPSGGYFYYAHLDSYSGQFRVGETVTAGTLLGRMGDSGYGPEGTRGKFDVHLHLGIYIRTEAGQELSVNPYWVLRYAEYL